MKEQKNEIRRLIETLKRMTEAERYVTTEKVSNHSDNCTNDSCTKSFDSVSAVIDNQVLMAHERMNDLPKKVRAVLKFEIGKIIFAIIDDISHVNTMRDLENKPIENELPSLMPAFLAQLRPRHSLSMLHRYWNHFESSMYRITAEQVQLSKSYETESALKLSLDQHQKVSFKKSSGIKNGRFPALRAFSGALYRVFSNKSSV